MVGGWGGRGEGGIDIHDGCYFLYVGCVRKMLDIESKEIMEVSPDHYKDYEVAIYMRCFFFLFFF